MTAFPNQADIERMFEHMAPVADARPPRMVGTLGEVPDLWRVVGEDDWHASAYTSTPPYTSSFRAPTSECTVELKVHTIVGIDHCYSETRTVKVKAP